MPNLRKPLAESYWVVPDRLLAGKYPGGKTAKEAERRLAPFLEAGFDTFIDLTEAGELPPYDIYLPGSVQYAQADSRPWCAAAREHMAEVQAVIDCGGSGGALRALPGRHRPHQPAVACHLIEPRLVRHAALIRLNEPGATTSAQAWPDVPETDEQRDYILDWSREADPMQAADVLDAARTLRERFQGALVGLAVGDALAAHTQFRKPGSFAAVGDLLGGGPFDLPRGAWTDDTAMALLADSLSNARASMHDQVQLRTLATRGPGQLDRAVHRSRRAWRGRWRPPSTAPALCRLARPEQLDRDFNLCPPAQPSSLTLRPLWQRLPKPRA
jgi:hypothetical protein